MIIGIDKLLQLVKEAGLVEDLSERELVNPEGAGFDLRLGGIYAIEGRAFLGIDKRETPEVKCVAEYNEKERETFIVEPESFYLITTVEKLNIPLDIVATFKPRTTTFRSGLFIRTGNVAPGYKGNLTFAMKNEGPVSVTLELGCRIVHVQFHWVDGKGSSYRGQWQGGRITTGGEETQV